MTRSRKRRFRIHRPRQLHVLASPARKEILDWMLAGRDFTVFDLAERMERKPSGLYYHLHQLVDAGFVVQRSERRAGKRYEAIYSVAREKVEHATHSSAAASSMAYAAAAILRRATRDFVNTDARGGSCNKPQEQPRVREAHVGAAFADGSRRSHQTCR